jgi:hypothetical protein
MLLIYPRCPDTFWSFSHALKFTSKRALNTPLSVLTVAALLPAEWEKKVIDMNVTSLTDKDIKWADYVFLSAMIVQRKSARSVIDRCHKLGIKVVGDTKRPFVESIQIPSYPMILTFCWIGQITQTSELFSGGDRSHIPSEC